jgi:hypothetical protein
MTFAAESQTEVGRVPVKQRENSNISNHYNYNVQKTHKFV